MRFQSSYSSSLRVLMNGHLVGHLNRSSNGAIDFQYDSSWLTWKHAFPISLSLPLKSRRFIGEPVIAVFDNLLPDNNIIRRRIAEKVRAAGIDAYNLLSVLGRDCVGALQFLPQNEENAFSTQMNSILLNDKQIEYMISQLAITPLGLEAENDFRISLAGAQEKTALLYWNKKWHQPLGTTPTTHILKPQIGRLPNGMDMSHSVENEYLCLKFLAALGIPSASAEIVDFGRQRTLIIERFDRAWESKDTLLRLPQEDICQALSVPPSLKYETDGGPGIIQILHLLEESDTADQDRELFLKAQLVFWLMGATDGHAKNYSLFLGPTGFRLTPFYDVLSTQPNVDKGDLRRNKMKFAMAIGKNRHYRIANIFPRHFYETAEMAELKKETVDKIITELRESIPLAIETTTKNLSTDFPEEIVTSIMKGIQERYQLL